MANPVSTLTIVHSSNETAANIDDELDLSTGEAGLFATRLSNLFRGLASGSRRGTVQYELSSASGLTAASATITCSSVTAGHVVVINGVTFTWTATPTLEGDVESDGSDDEDAAALAAAINAHSSLEGVVTASALTNVVTVSAVRPGREGNLISIECGERATGTLTCAQATTDEDDTFTVAGVAFTWKASPSGQSQVDIGADDDECAANVADAINAHDSLRGLCTAVAANEVVTVTATKPGIAGNLITLAETFDAITVSGANLTGGDVGGAVPSATFLSGGTSTQQAASRTYDFGGT